MSATGPSSIRRPRRSARCICPPISAAPVPAVILLHGASGVRGAREQTYGRQLAAMGIAALVIDAFAPRRDMGRGFVERILNITETMLIADAYAGLRYLAARPEIDGERVVMMGFSYGGMASVVSAYAAGRRAVRAGRPALRRPRLVLRPLHRPLRGPAHHRRAGADAVRRRATRS